jgi:hypothetical protein
MNTTERFEKVNIDRLVPYARNARTHSKEQIFQLRASLREFGFVNPVIVDKDLNVIAGHGRILAAKEEGITEVPCVFAEHLTEAQKRAYIIADNRLALNAGWDAEMLSVELADLQATDFDVSLLGFDDAELNKLLGGAEGVKEDDFDVEGELAKPAISKAGDLWLLGQPSLNRARSILIMMKSQTPMKYTIIVFVTMIMLLFSISGCQKSEPVNSGPSDAANTVYLASWRGELGKLDTQTRSFEPLYNELYVEIIIGKTDVNTILVLAHPGGSTNPPAGLEILTGVEAGIADENGKFPDDSIHGRVNKKLSEWNDKRRWGRERNQRPSAVRRRRNAW